MPKTKKTMEVKETTSKLPVKIFGLKPNEALLKQAVNIYLGNQRSAKAKAQTRAEVNLTKAKMFRQKGTGRARHGSQSAPIFVGGGKAHGPTGKENYKAVLTKKMISLAMKNALSFMAAKKAIVILEKINEVKKTKEIAKILSSERSQGQDMLILGTEMKNLALYARNLANLDLFYVNTLNIHAILKAGKIFIASEALKEMEKKWLKE